MKVLLISPGSRISLLKEKSFIDGMWTSSCLLLSHLKFPLIFLSVVLGEFFLHERY